MLSLCVLNAATGDTIEAEDPDRVHPTASIAKVLLLCEVARRIETGDLDPGAQLERLPDDDVSDSGLWHRLRASALPVEDLCVLVGAVSDNLATNVLVRHVGLDAVAEVGTSLGLRSTRLEDKVRDHRLPTDPPALSHGTAAELCTLVLELHGPRVLDPAVASRVTGWLALNTDLSMVAPAFGFDPLAHADGDRGLVLWNKTGTNTGVRADIGLLRGPAGAVAYAALASWSPEEGDGRDQPMAAMRALGQRLRRRVEG